MRKQQLVRYLSGIVCLLLFLNANVWAGIDPPVRSWLIGNQIRVDSTATVEDQKFFDPAYNALLIKPYSVQNTITFQIRESANVYLQSAFSASVEVRIKFTKADLSEDSVDQTLTINYNPDGPYTNKAVYLLPQSGYRVSVKVRSASTNVGWDVWKTLEIVNALQSVPQYQFSCTANALNQINHESYPANAEIDELPVSWPNSVAADEYDLEWTYIDDSAISRYGPMGSPDPKLLFENNASRVTISGSSYKIPLFYDSKGTLYFRVRPVQVDQSGSRLEANWSSDYLPAGLGRFHFNGHQRNLNWQATTTYAEEGKRKSVVQYFDGSLRSRQTVTKDSSTNSTIVAENYYDHQGRPVIQVLPVPTLNTVINYSRNFNVGLNGAEYDKDNFDRLLNPALYGRAGAAPMKSDSGAARYYSPANSEKNNGFHKYLPDAEGYPFIEVEYVQDNTGRISRQGGVGPAFQLGSGHETKYFYGSATQRELDALFGTEAGHWTHYFKTMVRDANGQFSVSYTDMSGRTIATALAGAPPDSIKLDKLSSYRTDMVTETLADPGSVIIRDLVMESKKGLLVADTGVYTFNYQLSPESLQKEGCNSSQVCYDCLYDLQITITDDCNNQKLGGRAFDTVFHNFSISAIDTSCANPAVGFSVSFSKFLEPGSYDVTKKLSISRYGMDYYRDSVFLKKNTCKTLQTFIDEQRQLVAASQLCMPTCQSCRDSLASWEQFRIKFINKSGIDTVDSASYRGMAWDAYQTALADCDALCGKTSEFNDIRKNMLLDLTPPSGQYANVDSLRDKYSIFYTDLNLNAQPDTVAIYKRPSNYVDASGALAKVWDEAANAFVTPSQLSPETFAQKFEQSWAETLLPYHPEYCKLQKLEELKASMEWNRRFEAVDTYREALAKGYLNPTNGTSSEFTKYNTWGISHPDPDPINSVASHNYKSELEERILKVKTQGYTVSPSGQPTIYYSMWAMANITACCVRDNFNQYSCVTRFNTAANVFDTLAICTGDLDMAWRSFRQMYLELKRERINDQLKAACASTPTPVALMAAHRQPNFGDASELFAANGTIFPHPTNEYGAYTYRNQNEAAMNSYFDANCKAYAKQWWAQLKGCFNQSDSAAIIQRLITVCKEGADANHPYGASSVKPASTNGDRSFEQVLRDFNGGNLPACNPYLITNPLPYDKQAAANEKPMFAKPGYSNPGNCECNQITEMYDRYQVVADRYTSFSDFLKRRYHTTISQTDLDRLLNMCNFRSSSCNFLEKPIKLPPVFQCGSKDVCINCTQFNNLDSEFRAAYPDIIPVMSPLPEDSIQWSKNKMYEQFLNYRLGFSKTYVEYLQFRDSCTGFTSICTLYDKDVSFQNIYTPYGGGGNDTLVLNDLHETADGGFVMGGYMAPYGHTFPGPPGSDAYWMTTNKHGNIQFQGNTGQFSGDNFQRVRPTSDGGYIAIGTDYDGPGYITNWSIGDPIIVKMYDGGYVEWSKELNHVMHAGTERAPLTGSDIIELSGGGYALVMNTTYWMGDPQSTLWSTVVVARLDEQGNILWLKNVSSPPSTATLTPRPFSLLEDGDALVVAGTLPYGVNDPFLIKLSLEDGEVFWRNIYNVSHPVNMLGSEQKANVQDVYKTNHGYRFGGWTADNHGQSLQQFVIDITTDGSVMQAKRLGSSYARSSAFYSTPDQGYLAAQSDYSDNAFFLSKMDFYGNIEWSKRIQIQGLNYGPVKVTKVIQAQNEDIIIVGTMYSGEAFLIRTDKNGNSNCTDQLTYITIDDLQIETEEPWFDALEVYYYDYHDYAGFGLSIWSEQNSVCYFEQNNDVCLSATSDFGPTLCGRSEPLFAPADVNTVSSCSDSSFFAISIAQELYKAYSDSLRSKFDDSYRAKCLQAYKYESFTVTHKASEYHYTLYYYDQAGNLVKTVPPQGVDISKFQDATWEDQVEQARKINQVLVPVHSLVTQYRYNTLNQVVAQKSPDGGLSKFWYDRLGRLTVSQNAQQLLDGKYSYTLFDALGRIAEVGQKPQATAMTPAISRDAGQFSSWMQGGGVREQITRTVYDVSYFNGDDLLMPQQLTQRNLRNRVSYTQVFDVAPSGGNYVGTHRAATYYSYDIHGNVDTLLQDYNLGVMAGAGNRFKKIAYNYDLISGKVNRVAYQAGQPDQYFHKYEYDADNKLVAVYTSADNLIWEREAKYEYYKHGPLARTTLGDQMVQGLDYAYTLQGWLKGVNSTSLGAAYDMGGDGAVGGANPWVGRDALGFSLDYFAGAYKAINTTVTPFPATHPYLGTEHRPLFNGNISSMAVNIGKFSQPMLYNYTYDQLNRITAMDAWTGLNESTNSWSGLTKLQEYKERVSYDGNGNILTYLRNGNGARQSMDQLTYSYKPGTNQLDQVSDAALDVAASEYDKYNDIKQGQGSGNYQYDAVGNLISDVSEGITNITWTVYGKIGSITKNGKLISYTYDASGNRISKTTNGKTTWYVRDASGNVMSVYETGNTGVNGGALTQSEVHLYGSSRLGIFNMARKVENQVANTTGMYTFERGRKFYELSNHLGNVLATVSDKKLGVPSSADPTIVDYYEAEVVSAQDYYPFGMGMPGRQFSAGSSYRYGFNGKENDPETLTQDYGMRINDPRLGRFLSVDPLTKKFSELTPYQFSSNTPIWAIDLDGLEAFIATESKGTGHAFLVVKTSDDLIVYTYGRYGAVDWNQTSGEGVLQRLTGAEAIDYINTELTRMDARFFQVNDVTPENVRNNIDKIYNSGKPSSVEGVDGKVIDDYSLFSSNCSTHSCDWLQSAGSAIFTESILGIGYNEDFIIPSSLQSYLEGEVKDGQKPVSAANDAMKQIVINETAKQKLEGAGKAAEASGSSGRSSGSSANSSSSGSSTGRWTSNGSSSGSSSGSSLGASSGPIGSSSGASSGSSVGNSSGSSSSKRKGN